MMMFDPCSIHINHMNKCGIECDIVPKFALFHAYDHTPDNKQLKGGRNYLGSRFESTVPVAAVTCRGLLTSQGNRMQRGGKQTVG